MGKITSEAEFSPIEINGHCARCLTCYRVCPFEAISINKNKPVINIEKCQLCGICASLCPEIAIKIAYYETESLIKYVKKQKEALETDTLVVMCYGSSPPSGDMRGVLNVSGYIALRLPCVGRLSAEFYLQAFLRYHIDCSP